jgi:glycosyltransferase involved in cell wall biosynthesis
MNALQVAVRNTVVRASATWRPYSRLFFVGEAVDWVIDEEQRALSTVARTIGIHVPRHWPVTAARRQTVFYGSHFAFFSRPDMTALGHRFATTYFHGRPGTPGMPEFDEAYASLRSRHEELDRVQVSHRELEEIVLSSGIDPAKVFRIPIGIEPAYFTPRSQTHRAQARMRLGLPDGAFVVGSFQKDGVGWGEGAEPKLIKGPDVLLDALALTHERVPELFVLLSAPARGYVKAGLEARRIPYVHELLDRYDEIGELYAALDAYVVPARQEGGPKGVLEAMAAGVPLVSTRVGQATDLVRDGENGWLVDVEDAEAIAGRLAEIAAGTPDLVRVGAAAVATAAANSYESQLPLWREFFDGVVVS